jgi:hypothetical protein
MAIDHGFTLHDIATFMARDFDNEEKPSKFETAYMQAEEFSFRYFDVKFSSHGNSIYNGTYSSKFDKIDEISPTTIASEEGTQLRRLFSVSGHELDHPQKRAFSHVVSSGSPQTIALSMSNPESESETTDSLYVSQGHMITESQNRILDSHSTLSSSPPLSRIVSFSAFDSDRIYSYQKKDAFGRQPPKLVKTRASLLQSSDFKKFRLDHALDNFRALLKRERDGSFDKPSIV